jgi:hypothetical protein
MPDPARTATSLLAGAAIAVIAALLVIGAPAGSAAANCGAASDRTYLSIAAGLARRINVGESTGGEVGRVRQSISSNQALAAAVAADDVGAVDVAVRALVFYHEHIVRLRVLRGAVVIDDLGGPFVLAPVRGTLRLGGRVVGSFVMSIQDDAGYRKLAERLVGAGVVIRYGGRTLMSDIALGDTQLPAHGPVAIAGRHYLVASFTAGRFPSGTLHISLLFPSPPAALARSTCAQIRADVLADVARRAYGEALSGPPVMPAVSTLSLDQALPQALAARDYPGAAKIVRGMVAGGGFARLWVSAGGRVIAQAGPAIPALAPLAQAIHDAAGAIVGRALFSVQSALGYSGLAHALTGAPILVRAGSRQLAGSFPGPPELPVRGPVSYRGIHYVVASFTATAFPRGAVRIYVLGRL